MANKFNAINQIISLPQGCRALHGIGETISPDLHKGTGNFRVPIALPPRRKGFQAQISLVLHSTSNGNGPYGLGWNLTIPGVSRKTSKGIPQYPNNASSQQEDETYILSGAEDFLPVAVNQAATRYHPGLEGLFAQIEHYLNSETVHREVGSKDTLVSFYRTPSSVSKDQTVIANPKNRAQFFIWKLSKTVDRFDNTIQFEYERDSQ